MSAYLLVAVLCGIASGGEPTPVDQLLTGLRSLLEDCPPARTKPAGNFVETLARCARERTISAIDDILEDDVIPLADGLELVRFQGERSPAARKNGTTTYSIRNLLSRVREKGQLEDKDADWQERMTSRVSRVLRSHVVKIDLERLMRRPDSLAKAARAVDQHQLVEARGKGRRRRRRQMQMMPMIMMGVLLMGSVLIPMGFQFLAVLGGKALILAKMALMLSSIQGLKKIATNGVNYGLYQAPVPEAWHERSTGYHEIPYAAYDAAAAVHEHGYVDRHGTTAFARRSAVQPT